MNGNLPNFTAGKAGLTGISGAATTHSSGSAGFNYHLRGKAFSKTQISGGTTPTTDAQTGAAISLVKNFGTVVAWAIDAAGAVKVFQGETVPLDAAGNFTNAPEFPSLPDTVAPFAYTLHKAGSTTVGTWTFGSSNWNATGMTHTVVDVFALPDRPQIS